MDFMKVYQKWCDSPFVDNKTKQELLSIKDNKKEIEERFFRNLEFGTAGLRGVLGAGTNRMNIYVVRQATQGLANVINKLGKEATQKGVVIAYDSRNMSREFAEECASVLTANGVRAYLFESLRPTPILSYAVRHLGATAGINITASHNPREYNGYKVYWSDGGQMPPHAVEKVVQEINATDIFADVKIGNLSSDLLTIIGEEIDEKYLDKVEKQCQNRALIEEQSDHLKIVYTPIHGSGNIPVRKILKRIGVKHLYLVEEQLKPDGNFPTVPVPNPENKACFDLAIEIAKKQNADLIIGTDPDCDRVGVVMRNAEGEYVTLTGNQIGVILLDYILSQKKQNGTLPKNGAVIKSIVTTDMAKKIAEEYGVTLFDVLTGFKYIGEKIHEFEQSHAYEYIFGFEESFGYLAGTYTRDKDAVVASMLIVEACAYYKSKNMTFYDGLMSLYEKFGYYYTDVDSITLSGLDGMKKIEKIMNGLRENPIADILGNTLMTLTDYKKGIATDVKTGEQIKIDLPSSDVLAFEMENNIKFVVRPSGTEPKIKVYYFVNGTKPEEVAQLLQDVVSDVTAKINAILA
jgi:phosphoglucomutase